MIHFIDKHDCCGCGACMNACPKACITMREDEEGFMYPFMDSSSCIDCGLCEKVCPFISSSDAKIPLMTYAAINPSNSERFNSSSGGIFIMLARIVLNQGGVVFGASFDSDWNVRHIPIESIEDISLLQGSKYVQSYTGDAYTLVKHYLLNGRTVLFSGTSCQVAGLRCFLHKDYDTLITVDVVCHGVPSPRVWKDYISYIRRQNGSNVVGDEVSSYLNDMPSIEGISFRDKLHGWRRFGFVIRMSSASDKMEFRENVNTNVFMQGFIKNLYLRPSCYSCKVRCGCCGSDLSLGDYWGIWNIKPEIDDNKGVSLVLVNTMKGLNILKRANPVLYEASYSDAVQYNPCIEHSVEETKWRTLFWEKYSEQSVVESIKNTINCMRPSFGDQVLAFAKFVLKRLLVKV